jgi:tetratricopeptide (TPR) repeat protein
MGKRIISFIGAVIVGFALQAQTLQEGLRFIDSEKYEASRDLFGKLKITEPKNGDNWFYLGQSYINLLQNDSAKASFEMGIQQAPANPANYAGLGELELIAENKTAAKVHFDKALSFSKNRAGVFTDIRAIALVAGSMANANLKMLDEAEALIKMGFEQDRKNYDLLIAGGDVYLERNDGGNAATFYERAIAIDPKNPKAYVRVSNIWIRVKNFEQAQFDLNRAFEKDPNYAQGWKYQAELYYAQRKFALAKEAYEKYLQFSEPSIANQVRFVRILFLSKAYDEALERIDGILAMDKNNLLLNRLRAFSIAEVLEGKNNPEQAKSAISSLNFYLTKVDPKKIIGADFEYLAKLLIKTGNDDSAAIANFRKAMEMSPNNIDIYTDLAKAYNKMRLFDSAALCYENYIAVSRKVTAADHFLHGKALYYAKQYAKSDSAFVRVTEIKPDYPDSYLWRGNCLFGLDPDFKTDAPKVQYEKYIELLMVDPEKFETSLKVKNKIGLINAYTYLGYYNLNKDKNVEAKEFYKKVIELDPNNAQAKKVLADKK